MNTSQELKRLINLVESRMEHDYSGRFVAPPEIDAAKALALYSVLGDAPLPAELADEYFAAVMLIQAALDMHDSVMEARDDERKGRQLSVLSGDYYSSMYYLILSQCEDITLIRHLSVAIQQINENKTLIHMKESSDPEIYIQAIRQKESLLAAETARRFGKEELVPFLEDYLFLAAVAKDRDSILAICGDESINIAVSDACGRMRNESCLAPSFFSRENRQLDFDWNSGSMTGEG
ncbi:heptaprenyl diphosphate synthase component 1 [Fictibacillus aquaticus]|nr:heptaprenyl diphosphate synthase component 1 [Fictibacillus aquaticus]